MVISQQSLLDILSVYCMFDKSLGHTCRTGHDCLPANCQLVSDEGRRQLCSANSSDTDVLPLQVQNCGTVFQLI